MRLLVFCFVIILISSMSDCKRRKPDNPPVDLGFLPIDSTCKRYWAFKEGSWWVYENKKGGKNGIPGLKDTIECTYFEYKVMAFESKYWKLSSERYFFVYTQKNQNEDGNMPVWEHSIIGPEGNNSDRPDNSWWAMNRLRLNPAGTRIGCFIYPYTAAVSGTSRFIKDTTLNGIKCNDVIVQTINPDGQMPDSYTHRTEMWWAKDIGMIRYVSTSGMASYDVWDFQIANYYINK